VHWAIKLIGSTKQYFAPIGEMTIELVATSQLAHGISKSRVEVFFICSHLRISFGWSRNVVES